MAPVDISDSSWQKNISLNSSSPDKYSEDNVFILSTDLRLSEWYIKIYLIYINMVTHGIIPMLTLTILNISIYKQVYTIYN